jgi:hypothetical protein
MASSYERLAIPIRAIGERVLRMNGHHSRSTRDKREGQYPKGNDLLHGVLLSG